MKDRDNEKCTQIKKEPISILSPNTAKNLQLVKNHTITSYLTFSICLARRILCSVPAGVFVVGIHFFLSSSSFVYLRSTVAIATITTLVIATATGFSLPIFG